VHVFAPGSVKTNVSRNALVADGSARGASDAAIEAGLDPADAADAMLAAIAEGRRELVLATGMEHDIVMLRRRDPEALFQQMSGLVRAGYAQSMASDPGKR
jgi:short-subunit dehydrogenase